ncbi:hypothetical protein SNE40_010849 [Patella caerulea]|uniref:Histidine N-acetyltransferase C-terminal domain-containing protein n=1 Tax=Patella caerulea TaxID=87958 RepID=A0AAN8K2T8_PATCE
MIGNVEDLKPNKFESDETNVQELTSGDLKKIFQSKAMCSKLFPGEKILPTGYPFRLLPQNIPLMMDGFKFWGTKSSDQSTYKTLTVTENYQLGIELMFNLGIYDNDAIDIQQHVLKHIQNLNLLVRNGSCTSIIIHITHPLDFSDTSFLSVFQKVGFKINNEFAINRYILLERKIR